VFAQDTGISPVPDTSSNGRKNLRHFPRDVGLFQISGGFIDELHVLLQMGKLAARRTQAMCKNFCEKPVIDRFELGTFPGV
jgi:RNA:NAD 2'-phosphotransferase (TPT1/KptA family)